MAEVRPFQGVRYRLGRPEDATRVIAPPYDVISHAQQETLYHRDPCNVIRLELPRDEDGDGAANNRYTRAAALFRSWLASGTVAPDPQPCLYVYGQRYQIEGRSQERLGLMAALKIEPYEAGVVLPHEQTFPRHKEDRYRMLTIAGAQFSPIFGLYSAPGAGVRAALDRYVAGPPEAVGVDHEGVEHRLWPVTDQRFAAWAEGLFRERQVFIADGHHRYETALRYRNERRAQEPDAPPAPSDYVMTFLVEMDDPGLVLLPTHRVVRRGVPAPEELRTRLSAFFDIQEVPINDADDLAHHQIGVVLPDGRSWRLTLKDADALSRLDSDHSPAWRDLDVALLHRLIFQEVLGLEEEGNVLYTRDPAEARDRVLTDSYAASFLLPAPRVEELKAVAGAGDRMPEKSTYFWPKAVTGLVIYEE